MKYKKLSDVAEYSIKKTTAISINSYISTENMIPNIGGVTIATSIPEVKSAGYYEPDNILLSNIRPYFCKIWFADKCGSVSNDVLVISARKGVYPKFLYYVLCDKNFFKYDTVTSKGTKMPRGTPNAIMKYQFPDIAFETQRRIVSFLSAYDELIEKNNRKIAILQEQAQELYKEWFVRFRFPGHETTNFENGLPEGWKRKRISVFYNTCSGGTPSREHEEYYNDGVIPWIKTGEIQDSIIIDSEEYITEDAIKHSSAKLLPAKSVVMAMYGVNIGKLAYFDKEMTCNQACCVFSDKEKMSSKHYLFYFLLSIREYLLLIGFGAAQQNLSQDLIRKVKVLMPAIPLVTAFEQKIDTYYSAVKELILQNTKLIRQRDLLLPRLMSGKLEV